jgi:hypothetical protein
MANKSFLLDVLLNFRLYTLLTPSTYMQDKKFVRTL